MASPYRSWAERRQIIRSIIADAAPPPLASFGLSPSEEVYFRARSDRMIDRLARRTSSFRTYYQLRTSQPFLYVVGLTLVIVTFGVAAGVYMYLRREQEVHLYPLLGASATLSVAAVGWCVAGWIAHRNAVRQNTNNILFARFSQTAFMESMHRFHREFGNDVLDAITSDRIRRVRTRDEEGEKAAQSVNYLLNYYEFIASGVLRGDLDHQIVRENIRGVICYYYDKCEPNIRASNQRNSRAFEHLIKLRTHYREP